MKSFRDTTSAVAAALSISGVVGAIISTFSRPEGIPDLSDRAVAGGLVAALSAFVGILLVLLIEVFGGLPFGLTASCLGFGGIAWLAAGWVYDLPLVGLLFAIGFVVGGLITAGSLDGTSADREAVPAGEDAEAEGEATDETASGEEATGACKDAGRKDAGGADQ